MRKQRNIIRHTAIFSLSLYIIGILHSTLYSEFNSFPRPQSSWLCQKSDHIPYHTINQYQPGMTLRSHAIAWTPIQITTCMCWWGLMYSRVQQPFWWLPNKILRHIHKKRFSVLLSRFLRICKLSVQKVLKRAKKFFFKFNLGVKKRRISRWFRIRSKSFEKMHPKKVISKNVTEICTFFTFTFVRQTCFACNYFGAFF
jgi:hypothetical protein